MAESEEKLPISDFYKVVTFKTIFKTEKWWEAVVVFENQGRRALGLYLWQNRAGQWKRKHKFAIKNVDEWNKLRTAMDQLIPKLTNKS
ncbi:hypothetical protein KAI12_01420 [Candidatus Bathyarchaeota archaeon]|nr:hypothetical protein [Candidatus Bathyarchaeota archaeon]